jgi:hypothetical protein
MDGGEVCQVGEGCGKGVAPEEERRKRKEGNACEKDFKPEGTTCRKEEKEVIGK